MFFSISHARQYNFLFLRNIYVPDWAPKASPSCPELLPNKNPAVLAHLSRLLTICPPVTSAPLSGCTYTGTVGQRGEKLLQKSYKGIILLDHHRYNMLASHTPGRVPDMPFDYRANKETSASTLHVALYGFLRATIANYPKVRVPNNRIVLSHTSAGWSLKSRGRQAALPPRLYGGPTLAFPSSCWLLLAPGVPRPLTA